MDECIFCKIAVGEVPSKKVYEDSHSFAFLDINPRNPGHTLVIPKKHARDMLSIEEGEAAELMKAIRKVSVGVSKATGAGGISISQSNGQVAGQVVPHVHFHIIPRTEAEKGMGLESVFPVKKQEEAALDDMARKISGSVPGRKEEPQNEEQEARPEEPEREEPAEDPGKEEVQEDEKKARSPDQQEINFDF